MSKVDYAAMSLDEAKRYFLAHRDDQEAFHSYMDKLNASGRAIVIDPTDPNSEAEAIVKVKKKLGLDHNKTQQ